MGKPMHHANGSVNKFGGQVDDYLPIHEYIDLSKEIIADLRHRFLTHHTLFTTFIIEKIFGYSIRNSSGREVAVRDIAELHLLEDFRMKFMPSAQDWSVSVSLEDWLEKIEKHSMNPLNYAKLAAKNFGGSYKAYLPINDLMEYARVAVSDARSKIFTHNDWFIDHVVVAFFGQEISVPVKRKGKKIIVKVSVRDIAEYHLKCTFGDKPIMTGCDMLSAVEPLPWMDNAKDNSLPPSQEKLRPILTPLREEEMRYDGPRDEGPMIVDGGPIPGGGGMRFDGGPRYSSVIGASMQRSMMDDVVSDFAGLNIGDQGEDGEPEDNQKFGSSMYGSLMDA